MTARASGAFASLPTSQPSAIGDRPTMVVRLVIRIGRSRVRPARTTASLQRQAVAAQLVRVLDRSTPFDTTMPTIMMMPMNDVVDSVVWVRKSARMTPISPMGTENMMMNGSFSDGTATPCTM